MNDDTNLEDKKAALQRQIDTYERDIADDAAGERVMDPQKLRDAERALNMLKQELEDLEQAS